MSYQAAIDYLYSFLDSEAKLPRSPLEFNLPRTRALLHAVGNPQQSFQSIVVAGTKGKGSTAVMLEAIVRAAGYRTGLWTSPHLHSWRERVQINREPINRDMFVARINRLRSILDAFDQERHGKPSVFDVGFTLALDYFAEQHVEIAVLEVGLGGRYDSANAVTPLVSVITSISYDHMNVLGSTLGEIAYQKAGIAKPEVPLVTVPQAAEAMTVVSEVATEVGAPLHVIGDEMRLSDGTMPLTPQLHGTFQRQNARLAVGAAQVLVTQGLSIDNTAIKRGLDHATWPGRFEIVPGTPTYVLDGAHNKDSAEQLVASLRESYPGRRVVLVFGTTRDKDAAGMLQALVPIAPVVVLTYSQHPRAETNLAALAEQTQQHGSPQLVCAEDISEALRHAQTLAAPSDLICVTGSLFVVAAAREVLGLAHERD